MSDIISDAKPVQVDLSNCEKEPIHIPGHIQAGGALLVLDGEEKLITQASTNVSSVLGHAATELLNQPVDAALPAEPLTLLRDIQPDLLENNPTYICTFETPAGGHLSPAGATPGLARRRAGRILHVKTEQRQGG